MTTVTRRRHDVARPDAAEVSTILLTIAAFVFLYAGLMVLNAGGWALVAGWAGTMVVVGAVCAVGGLVIRMTAR